MPVGTYTSPLGRLLLTTEQDALTGAWFWGQRYFPHALAAMPPEENDPVLRQAAAWLDTYFSGLQPGPTPPLDPTGTPFQKSVWRLLAQIPYGRTTTYGQLAKQLREAGGVGSPRAVGAAVGRNPISLFLPCHRVVGAGGALTGYAGGLERKAALLALERGSTPISKSGGNDPWQP